MKNVIISIKAFIIFSILLGLVYPLAITGIAKVVFPQKANGSLIIENGKVTGSSLIGQKFDKPEYFNSRPSAVDYNASGSGASNLGPTSKKLMERIKDANSRWQIANSELSLRDSVEAIQENNFGLPRRAFSTPRNDIDHSTVRPFDYSTIPADAVLTSASGLDPHISIENAKLQTKRVAKIRRIPEEKVSELITQNTDSNFLGIWGQDGVNVLKLNIALDKTKK